MTASNPPDEEDYITVLRFSPILDRLEFLYDESEEFNFNGYNGNWSFSNTWESSINPTNTPEHFVTNNAYVYGVITNNVYEYNDPTNIVFASMEFEASLEPNEDHEGNNIIPTTLHPFEAGQGYNPTNLLGVSYVNVLENKTDLTTAVTNLPFALDLPFDIQFSEEFNYYANSDLVAYYAEDTFGYLSGLYLMGSSEFEISTNALDIIEGTSAHSNYNARISNGTLARDPISEVDTALDDITTAFFEDFTATNNYGLTSFTAGDLNYQNGLLLKPYEFSIADYYGINYTGTFHTVLTDSEVTILGSWFHADHVDPVSADALLSSIQNINATGSNYVHRFDPPESHNAVTHEWTINFASTLPNWGTSRIDGSNSNGYQRIHHLYTLPNERLLCIYNAETNDVRMMYEL